jgi:hypothetical protein
MVLDHVLASASDFDNSNYLTLFCLPFRNAGRIYSVIDSRLNHQ